MRLGTTDFDMHSAGCDMDTELKEGVSGFFFFTIYLVRVLYSVHSAGTYINRIFFYKIIRKSWFLVKPLSSTGTFCRVMMIMIFILSADFFV
jgi:hypothetical protein